MPQTQEKPRGVPARYRAIRIGKGKNARIMHIAIVRKKGLGGSAGTPKD